MSEILTRAIIDRSTGKIAIERVQDVEDIIERNKALQNEPQDTSTGFHHIAAVPNIFIEKYCSERGVSYRELMQDFDNVIIRMCRDPDYAWLRTTNKRF